VQTKVCILYLSLRASQVYNDYTLITNLMH